MGKRTHEETKGSSHGGRYLFRILVAPTHHSSRDKLDKTTVTNFSHILGHHHESGIPVNDSNCIDLLDWRIKKELERFLIWDYIDRWERSRIYLLLLKQFLEFLGVCLHLSGRIMSTDQIFLSKNVL